MTGKNHAKSVEQAIGEAPALAPVVTVAEAQLPKPQRELYVQAVAEVCPFEKGSNRAEWYAYAATMVGKTADEFVAAAKAKAEAGEAVSYHKRGKRAGQAEDPVEWLLWMGQPKQAAVKLAYRVKE